MAKLTTAATLASSALDAAQKNENNSSLTGLILGDILKRARTNQTFSINGNNIVTKENKVNGTKTNYNLTNSEKNILDYTNENILNGLKNINVFSDNTKENIQKQVDAYKNQGLRTINETYTPMFRELKSDIASRFGNLDNSVFLDNLNEIEKNRTNAIATLTENILAKQNELYETEMNNRYNYLNALTSANENIYSNILNFLRLGSN